MKTFYDSLSSRQNEGRKEKVHEGQKGKEAFYQKPLVALNFEAMKPIFTFLIFLSTSLTRALPAPDTNPQYQSAVRAHNLNIIF
jgi:hypothetical protein